MWGLLARGGGAAWAARCSAVAQAVPGGQARTMASKSFTKRIAMGVHVGEGGNAVAAGIRMMRAIREDENPHNMKARHETKSARKYRLRNELERRIKKQEVNRLIREAMRMKDMGY